MDSEQTPEKFELALILILVAPLPHATKEYTENVPPTEFQYIA